MVNDCGSLLTKNVILVPLKNCDRYIMNEKYLAIFKKASELQLTSLAIPALGTGIFFTFIFLCIVLKFLLYNICKTLNAIFSKFHSTDKYFLLKRKY